MPRDLFNRYIWLVDTIRRYGRITRSELDECWRKSQFSGGASMPRRTFGNYRQAAEEMFDIEIKCDPATFEYFIEGRGDAHSEGVTDWLLNTAVTNDVLTKSRDVASKIFIENVPSARDFLAPAIEALRGNRVVKFDYQAYTRSTVTRDVVFEPYFLKLFRQRWYLTGRHCAENRIKTYALDRMSALRIQADTFEPDPAFDAEEYFRDSFGIVSGKGDVHDIVLKVDPTQAKYFRTLPLHRSQEESVHDTFSLFHYRMRITPDLVAELLSHGPRLTVVSPPELRAMMTDQLRQMLENYN